MSVDRIKFLMEIYGVSQSDPNSKLFDNMEQALRYSRETEEPVYAMVWENGKIL